MILKHSAPLKFSIGEDVKLTGGSENGNLDIGGSGKIVRFDIGSYRSYARVRRPDGNVEDWVNFNRLKSLSSESVSTSGPVPGEVHGKLMEKTYGISNNGRYSISFLNEHFYPSDLIDWVQTYETISLPLDMRRERDDLANLYDGNENYSNEAIFLERNYNKVGGVWRKLNDGKVEVHYLGVYPNEENHSLTLENMMRLCAVDSFFEKKPLSAKVWEGNEDFKIYEKFGFRVASVEEGFYKTGDNRLNLEYSCDEEKTREHIAHLIGDKK